MCCLAPSSCFHTVRLLWPPSLSLGKTHLASMFVCLCMDFYSPSPCELPQLPLLSADVSTSLTAALASSFSVSGNCTLAAGTQKHNGNNTCRQERARLRKGEKARLREREGAQMSSSFSAPRHNSISASHSGTAPINRRHNERRIGGLLLGFFFNTAPTLV